MHLKQLRKRIDLIDTQILTLLNDRMEQAVLLRKLKKQVLDSDREAEVLARVRSLSGQLVSADFAEKLYKQIMEESRNLQTRSHVTAAFQGEHGSYSEAAVLRWQPDAVPVPQQSFADIFEGLEAGTFDYGVVPVENSLGGIVGEVNNLLLSGNVEVVRALDMNISHCLLMVPGSDFREIRSVYSHGQALSQCREFISRNHLEPVVYYDTAGAAKMLARKQLKGAAAIAGELAARLYNLEIVKEDIQGQGKSRTRFFVIRLASGAGSAAAGTVEGSAAAGDQPAVSVSTSAADRSGQEQQTLQKCSIVFATRHKAGNLFAVLNIFAAAGINLTRIESVPSDKPGDFTFFIDFVAEPADPSLTSIFDQLREHTLSLKVLGFYTELVC
ncbi:MAG: chorismate mutase [Spirochaetes bacterium]|nr:chorismate mutase [Spirochaetota bacterium]MBU0956550.1 chorismate mutase [Spirochaetota bacterium]